MDCCDHHSSDALQDTISASIISGCAGSLLMVFNNTERDPGFIDLIFPLESTNSFGIFNLLQKQL